MSSPVFGLYSAPAMTAAQRVQAGHAAALNVPITSAGVTLFRRSYWLPIPALLGTAQAVRLAGGSLRVRFTPLRMEVGTDVVAWFTSVEHVSDNEVRIKFAWPAQVVAIPTPPHRLPRDIELLRADGAAVAGDPTLSGRTGEDLPEPWIGSPLVVRLGESIHDMDGRKVNAAGARAAGGSGAGAGPIGFVPDQAAVKRRLASSLVPALTLAGRPTTPRLRLVAEHPDGEKLLWQALLPGEQGTVTLPAKSLADEWAPALEQLRSLCAEAATMPTRLRLDLESDAPCNASIDELSLPLRAEIELLGAPRQLAFDGQRPQERLLPLDLPAGLAAAGLTLSGRVVADAGADAAAAAPPSGARLGALLVADQVALQPLNVTQPAAVAGVAFFWQPLSDQLRATLSLLADGGDGPGGPGGQVLAEQTLALDTPEGSWLAFRWPAIDLQTQRVWARLAVEQGAGLCLFSAATTAGLLQARGPAAQPQPLPQGLAMALVPAAAEGAALRPIALSLAGQTVAAALPAAALSLQLPESLLPLLATHPLAFTGGVRGSITVDSARVLVLV